MTILDLLAVAENMNPLYHDQGVGISDFQAHNFMGNRCVLVEAGLKADLIDFTANIWDNVHAFIPAVAEAYGISERIAERIYLTGGNLEDVTQRIRELAGVA